MEQTPLWLAVASAFGLVGLVGAMALVIALVALSIQ